MSNDLVFVKHNVLAKPLCLILLKLSVESLSYMAQALLYCVKITIVSVLIIS